MVKFQVKITPYFDTGIVFVVINGLSATRDRDLSLISHNKTCKALVYLFLFSLSRPLSFSVLLVSTRQFEEEKNYERMQISHRLYETLTQAVTLHRMRYEKHYCRY